MENPQKDIPRAVYASGVIVFLGYAVPIIGIILLLSSKDLSSVTGFISAYQVPHGRDETDRYRVIDGLYHVLFFPYESMCRSGSTLARSSRPNDMNARA